MKGPGFVNTLGNVMGIILMLLGLIFVTVGSLAAPALSSGIEGSSLGIKAAAEAIRTASGGVSNSSGIIEEVRLSLETTSSITSSTAQVIESTILVLDNIKIMMPLLASDMSSMPPMVRNLMPSNNFDEVAIRTEEIAEDLGILNQDLSVLSTKVSNTGSSIIELAEAVQGIEENLLYAEGSFGNAADNLDKIALSVENVSYIYMVVFTIIGIGVFVFFSGLHQILIGLRIKKLIKEKSNEIK